MKNAKATMTWPRLSQMDARKSRQLQSACMAVTMLLTMLLILLCASELFAAGSGMPWESTLNKILASLQGPVARFVGILAIVMTGLAFALGEGGGFFKQGLAVAFGLSVAFGATTFITEFGFAGGALI